MRPDCTTTRRFLKGEETSSAADEEASCCRYQRPAGVQPTQSTRRYPLIGRQAADSPCAFQGRERRRRRVSCARSRPGSGEGNGGAVEMEDCLSADKAQLNRSSTEPNRPSRMASSMNLSCSGLTSTVIFKPYPTFWTGVNGASRRSKRRANAVQRYNMSLTPKLQ